MPRSPRNKIPNAHRGFTLVELLVVIAIVAILAGIILPMLGRARDQAKMTTSANNLKQLGAAVMVFSAEHKGTLPVYDSNNSTHFWIHALWQVIYQNSNFLSLPTVPDNSEKYREVWGGTVFYTPMMEDGDVVRSYGYNDRLHQYTSTGVATNPATPLRLNQLLNPSRTVVLGDSTSINFRFETAKGRNAGEVYCVFADGHVDKLLPPLASMPNPAISEDRMPYNAASTFWRGVEYSPTGTKLTVW